MIRIVMLVLLALTVSSCARIREMRAEKAALIRECGKDYGVVWVGMSEARFKKCYMYQFSGRPSSVLYVGGDVIREYDIGHVLITAVNGVITSVYKYY